MELDSSRSLKDPKLLKQAAVIFTLVLIGFVLNNFIQTYHEKASRTYLYVTGLRL